MRLLPGAFLLGCLLTPVAAMAQSSTNDEAIASERLMVRFVECVVERHDVIAEKIALEPRGTARERRLMQRIAESDCLTAQMEGWESVTLRFSPDLFRAHLAEQLYKAGIGAEAGPVAAERTGAPAPGTGFEYGVAVGRCVTSTEPVAADALLRTEVGSAEEAAAAGALIPAVRACVLAGAELRLNVRALRGIIAEARFRDWMTSEGRSDA